MNNNKTFIIFQLHQKLFALDINNIIEVINLPELEISSSAPEGIIGICNYKGIMIKVIDICALLKLPSEKFSINNPLIIVNNNGSCYAIYAQSVLSILSIDDNNIQPIPYNSESSIISFIHNNETQTINILDVNKIDSVTEKIDVNSDKVNYLELFSQDEKTKQILELRNQMQLENIPSYNFSFDSTLENQYIVFTLDNFNYCIDLKYIKELVSIKRFNIVKLPYTEDFIKGLINIRGEFLLIIDLKRFLSNNNQETTNANKLIIIEGKNFNLGLLADDIKYIKNIKNINVTPAVNLNSEYISSEFMDDGILNSILNVEKILNDERLYIDIE